MNGATPVNTTLISALGAMVAGQALAADLRFQGTSCDWTNTVAVDGFGWQNGGGGPGGLPGTGDTARLNWGGYFGTTVTLPLRGSAHQVKEMGCPAAW